MGRVGKSYRNTWANAEGMQRFDRELTEPEARELGKQVAGALVLVLVVLSVIGWAFTL
jgi:hypothetical protein